MKRLPKDEEIVYTYTVYGGKRDTNFTIQVFLELLRGIAVGCMPPFYAVIPCRYASTRLPAKPLADIGGKPMFWHVYTRAKECASLENVWLATDDARVEEAAAALGVPFVHTSPAHTCGTDRVEEATRLLGLPENSVIVNIQGDEPLLNPAMLDDLLTPFSHTPALTAATLAYTAAPEEAALVASPNKVKIACAQDGFALYFSRTPIPFGRDEAAPYLFHIGLYAFSRSTLALFTSLPPSPLEKMEKLEQLRLLEHHIPLFVARTSHRSHGVDSPEDLAYVRAVFARENQHGHALCPKE